jgi:dTDP-4-amino-4,6-dideoxygalactose transaminase
MPTERWRVPRIRHRQNDQALKAGLLEAFEEMLDRESWREDLFVKKAEQDLAGFIGLPYVSTVQSGSAALRLALVACGLKPGDEVVTVANSDISTTAAISHCGGKVVFCDISESDYTLAVDRVEELITDRTAGILPVDLYGHPADVKRLRSVAERYGLFIVEDAALAMGSKDYGENVGAYADAVIFSLAPTKNLSALGQGGIVATNRFEIYEQVEILKAYGRPFSEAATVPLYSNFVAEGYNLRMHTIDAAALTVKMPFAEQRCARRREIGRTYASILENVDRIKLPSFREGSEPVFRSYVVRTQNRDRVTELMRSEGVEVTLNYIPAMHKQPVYESLPARNLSNTDAVCEQIMCLPVFPEMTDEEIRYVCDRLMEATGKN